MNEQIKLLAEKADNYAEQTVRYYSGQVNGLTWEVKIKQARDTKFAELIVGECMDIARNVGNISEPDDWALDRCYEIEQKIQDRFGVEE